MQEPTLEQLEKLLEAFRSHGGTDAELSAVAQDIIREFVPEKTKDVTEIFVNEFHPTIAKIHEFKKDERKPVKHAWMDALKKRWFKYPLIFILAFITVFGIINWPLILTKLTPTHPVKYETVKEVITQETEKSAPLDPGEVVPAMDEVVIPKIAVTAPINFINSNAEADIKESLRTGVVHYYGTANPGEVGNTFITGHSSNYWWEKGGYNYVFANLNKLAVGDQAKIYYKGNKFIYQVKNIKIVEPTDVSVLQPTSVPTLTLMTCTPPGTNWKRLIIQFDQISPTYKAPSIVEKQVPVQSKALPQADSNSFMDWVAKLFGF